MSSPDESVTRVHTPTFLQMEAVECGAAALAMVLAYHGRWVPLEVLRVQCGVSRDGTRASNIAKVARTYGLDARGYKKEVEGLRKLPWPAILFWNFKHFVVFEGFGDGVAYLNDPATGPRVVSLGDFDQAFTGVALGFRPTDEFVRGGSPPNAWAALRRRLAGVEDAVGYVFLASLLLVVPDLLVPVLGRIFVDEVLVGGGRGVGALVLGLALTAALRAGVTRMRGLALLRLEARLSAVSSAAFVWHVLQLPMEFFGQRQAGEIGDRVQINDRLARLLAGQLATHALHVLTMAALWVAMLQYHALLAMIGVVAAAANLAVLHGVARRRLDAHQRLLRERGQLVGISTGGLRLIETLKASGAEDELFGRWAGTQAKALNAEQALGAPTEALGVAPALLSSLTTASVLGLGGLAVMRGELTLGMLVAIQSLMASFLRPLEALVALGGQLQDVRGDLVRLEDVTNYPLPARPPEPPPGSSAPRLRGHVELKGVTFGYSRLEPPLIEALDLTLRPGERVALVGASGCGKSTVARVVAGLYEPWSGEVLFDGLPRGAHPRATLVDSVGMVDQDIFLFEGTVRENLTMWDATVPEERMIRAARDAAIHDALAERAGAYDARVEEGGRNFSGGQRQRLEIARALVNGPSVLILDEATSAIDSVMEERIGQNLRRRGCSCIIIAHRLSTIRDCDQILVLDAGRVVQRGTHESLAAEPGPYQALLGSAA